MTVSFEAVPHSPSSGVAQPQSSMKESYPAKVHLQEVDQTATGSSTSNKSTSLQLLLLLHTTVSDAALRRRNGGSGTARARCRTLLPSRRGHAETSWPCTRPGVGRSSRRHERGRLPPHPPKLTTAPCIEGRQLVQGRRAGRNDRETGVFLTPHVSFFRVDPSF